MLPLYAPPVIKLDAFITTVIVLVENAGIVTVPVTSETVIPPVVEATLTFSGHAPLLVI